MRGVLVTAGPQEREEVGKEDAALAVLVNEVEESLFLETFHEQAYMVEDGREEGAIDGLAPGDLLREVPADVPEGGVELGLGEVGQLLPEFEVDPGPNLHS